MKLDTKAILDRLKPKQLKVVPSDVQHCTARLSPDGGTLAAGSFIGTIPTWQVKGDDLVPSTPITGHHGFVQCLLYHPDGRLFSADSWGQIRCSSGWAIENAHAAWIRKLALSPDGQTLASASLDRTIRLWSVADGKKIKELPAADDVLSIAFHPDRNRFVSGNLHGIIQEWDLTSGKVIRELDAKLMFKLDRIQEVGGVRNLIYNADGTTLFAAGAQPTTGGFVQAIPLLMMFETASGKNTLTAKLGADNEGYVHDVAWHPDGFLMLVTSGQPGAGKLHFIAPGEEKPFFTAAMPNCHALALHPTGKRLIISATNANSSGNGRVKGKGEMDYPGNSSPLHLWNLG